MQAQSSWLQGLMLLPPTPKLAFLESGQVIRTSRNPSSTGFAPPPISVTEALVMYETREGAKELKNEDTPPSSC